MRALRWRRVVYPGLQHPCVCACRFHQPLRVLECVSVQDFFYEPLAGLTRSPFGFATGVLKVRGRYPCRGVAYVSSHLQTFTVLAEHSGLAFKSELRARVRSCSEESLRAREICLNTIVMAVYEAQRCVILYSGRADERLLQEYLCTRHVLPALEI